MKVIKNIFKRIEFWISVWFLFVTYYAISLRYNFHTEFADYVAYYVQLVADILIAVFGSLAYLKINESISKRFYGLILWSIFIGLVSTETYNVLINIVKIEQVNSVVHQLWIFPYTLFLLVQIAAWGYLMLIKKDKYRKEYNTWVLAFPYIQVMIVLSLSVFLFVAFKNIIFVNMGFIQRANTVLEAFLFVLMTVCLARSKNQSLTHVGMGFLFLISFNLAHRFSYLTGHYYKSFDIIWLICYVVIIYGLSLAIKSSDEPIEFFPRNSIHVYTSVLFTMFATILFILFLTLGFIVSSIEINDIGSLNIFPESIPSILVFSFTLSVLAGKIVAERFSKPLGSISKRIDLINESNLRINQIPEEQFEIYELDKLDKFIMNTISELNIANSVKAEFLMNMSHDFRTPASGIYYMSRSIYKRITDHELKKLQKLIVDSSEQLMRLLEDILDYSRLESGKYELKNSMIDIKTIINEIILFLSAKAEEKELEMRAEIPSSIMYTGDRLIINRVLLNIVSNAIKFTHSGGVIITAFEEMIDEARWIVINVKDTGIGIEDCNQNIIFEPFTRIESAETSKYPGIGLGLSNVVLMLNKIGGKVTVNSRLNRGSTFSIFLPIA